MRASGQSAAIGWIGLNRFRGDQPALGRAVHEPLARRDAVGRTDARQRFCVLNPLENRRLFTSAGRLVPSRRASWLNHALVGLRNEISMAGQYTLHSLKPAKRDDVHTVFSTAEVQ